MSAAGTLKFLKTGYSTTRGTEDPLRLPVRVVPLVRPAPAPAPAPAPEPSPLPGAPPAEPPSWPLPWPDPGPSTEVAGFCERPKISRNMTLPEIIGGSDRERQVMTDTVRLCHRYTWYAVMMLDHIAAEVDRGDYIRANCLWRENKYPETFMYLGFRSPVGYPCLRYYFGNYNKDRMEKLRSWLWNLLRFIEEGDYSILIHEPDCLCPEAGICISQRTIYYCDPLAPDMTPILLSGSLLHEMYHGVGGKHSADCDGKHVADCDGKHVAMYATGGTGLYDLGRKCPDLAIINPFSIVNFCMAVGLAVDGNVGTPPCDGHRDPSAVYQPFYWGKTCSKQPPKDPDDKSFTLAGKSRADVIRLAPTRARLTRLASTRVRVPRVPSVPRAKDCLQNCWGIANREKYEACRRACICSSGYYASTCAVLQLAERP